MYPNATQKHKDDDKVDEASSLITIATAAPAASVSFGHEGMPVKKKKNGGAPMRAMIATTCFFLGTLVVIYGGRGNSSSSNNTQGIDGTSEALLLGQNQAALEVYDPSTDFCFGDNANANIYCWYPGGGRLGVPRGQWRWIGGRGDGDCGDRCTNFKVYRKLWKKKIFQNLF